MSRSSQVEINFAVFLVSLFVGSIVGGFPGERLLLTTVFTYFSLLLLTRGLLRTTAKGQLQSNATAATEFLDILALSVPESRRQVSRVISGSSVKSQTNPPSMQERELLEMLGEDLQEFFEAYEYLSIGDMELQRKDIRQSTSDSRWIHLGWNPEDHVEIVTAPGMNWVAELEHDIDPSLPLEFFVFPSVYHYILFWQ